MRKNKPKPIYCEICNERKPNIVHNKDGKYTKKLSDWAWVCKRCHIETITKAIKERWAGYEKKLDEYNCENCGIEFKDKGNRGLNKFCSFNCYAEYRRKTPKFIIDAMPEKIKDFIHTLFYENYSYKKIGTELIKRGYSATPQTISIYFKRNGMYREKLWTGRLRV